MNRVKRTFTHSEMEDVIIGRVVGGGAADDEASTSLDGAEFGVFSGNNCR